MNTHGEKDTGKISLGKDDAAAAEKKIHADEKAVLLDKIRELEKQIEILKNNYQLKLDIKDKQIEMVKQVFSEKVKKWDEEYGDLLNQKKEFEKRARDLEGNLTLARRDNTQRYEQLLKDKENVIRQLEEKNKEIVIREKDRLRKEKQEDIEKYIKETRDKLEEEMKEVIEKQRDIWQKELKKKEKEIAQQRNKWQNEFEKQRVEFEKREKEYLDDLLKRFGK
ncbi:MAG: hypothetical protein JXJ19_05735 [Elusimicrobia bacterium]|nr:hypothetical protein [Elusimicrobiota bacterium]